MNPVQYEFRQTGLKISQMVLPREQKSDSKESYAQVESLVAPNSGGLKPGGSTSKQNGSTARKSNGDGATHPRPTPLGVRFSQRELQIVKDKARAAGCSTNSYIRATALGSDYQPPNDPALAQVLFALNLELTRQGTNLNQIAHRLNAGFASDGDTLERLRSLAPSMRRTHMVIRAALAGGSEPDHEV